MHQIIRVKNAEVALKLVAQAVIFGEPASRFCIIVNQDKSKFGIVIKSNAV